MTAVINWLIDWQAHWLTGWHSDLLIDWLISWLTDWLVAGLLTDLPTALLTNLLTNTIDWLDWLVQLLTDCVTDRLLDWLASSLTNWLEWLTDVLRFMLRKDINFNACLHDVNQDYCDCWSLWKWLMFHFRSDLCSRFVKGDFNSQDFELIFSTVHVSAVYIALQSSYWVNLINWICSACLKYNWCTVSSAFSGHTWPNLTQIQNCKIIHI